MKSKFNVKQLTLLAMLVAVLLLMAFTPLGYLNIGLLAITFNVIPVAIGAIALGPAVGLIAGSVFGLTSFLQCIGIGGLSLLGSTLFSINPFFTIVLCFVPRMLDGFLLGYIFRIVGRFNRTAACFVTGFFAAFLNTAFYMSALVLLFGRTELISSFPWPYVDTCVYSLPLSLAVLFVVSCFTRPLPKEHLKRCFNSVQS